MQSTHITQIVISKLRNTQDREKFLSLSQQMLAWFFNQDGFISYEIYENDLNWADKIVYRDKQSAEQINCAFGKTDIYQKMIQLVQPDYCGFLGTQIKL